MTTYKPIADDLAIEIVGEGVHTGLRRGSDAEDAFSVLWRAISQSKTSAWSDACHYFVDGLSVMNLAICEQTDTPDDGLLARAADAIEGLMGQQAMTDDAYNAHCDAIVRALRGVQ